MSICLCNLSADAALELVAQKQLELTPASPDSSLFSVDAELAKTAIDTIGAKLPTPLEFLVGDAKKRRQPANTACHVWKGSLPKGGIVSLADGVYISSPEFTLLQQASQLHQASLCMMLGRYTGTWTPIQGASNGQNVRSPLTNLEALSGFLHNAGCVRGQGNLRLAMSYTCEGAASAPETSLQLALCLPPELRGLHLPPPIMNYEVDLSTEAQKLYPHTSIRIDLCWPHKRFGLEYQGEDHKNQLGDDYARWFAARIMGYELWFVAKEQLSSAEQMMRIAREVANRIGFDADEGLWPSASEFQDLLDLLAGKRHQKPVDYNALRKRRTKAHAWERSALR